MIGKQILNYEIKSVLGEGGMGIVYLAEHVKLGRQVAIKVLLPHLVKNELVRSRFINEAKLMASLHHPNIVTLYDYQEDENGLSLIMELVEGKSLDEYIQQVTGPIQEKEAVILMKQTLEGFAYAHKQGLIHRDIKPSNLIVTESKEIKILDFGIAKLVGDLGNKLTKTGSHIGTVFYMSPEQVRGYELDLRSDIYALGITFYQMLTGLCPYDSLTSEFDIFNKIVGEELPDPRTIYPGISLHMCHVIQKATAKKPEDRFQTCAAFIKGLKKDDFILSTEAKNDVSAPVMPVIENVVELQHQEATINVDAEIKQNSTNNKRKKRIILFSISGCILLAVLLFFFVSPSSLNDNNQLSDNKSSPVSENKENEGTKNELSEELAKVKKERLELEDKINRENQNENARKKQIEIDSQNERKQQNEIDRQNQQNREKQEKIDRQNEIDRQREQDRQNELNRQRERDREQQEAKKIDKNIVFKNNSSVSIINVALLYWDGSTWVTKGWYASEAGSSITLSLPNNYTTGYFYYHAYSGNTSWGNGTTNKCVSNSAFTYYDNVQNSCPQTKKFVKETVTGKTTYVTFGN